MFERRLKLFLAVLVLVTAVLVIRAAHLQVWQREAWSAKAIETMKRSHTTETWRGRILDCKRKTIAVDRPCVDACVDFRALQRPADPNWLKAVAIERLKNRLREGYKEMPKSKRDTAIAEETQRVQADLDAMWGKLAELSKRPVEEIEQTRDDVVKRVTMRRHYVWYRSYQLAMKKFEQREPTPGWRRWLIDESAETPTQDQFTTITVAEELADHPILKAISTDLQNELRKHIEQYPGLELKPGVQRYYPYDDTGCHLIGHLTRVAQEDLKSDPNVGVDELRQYLPNDLIGRTGLEKLGEPLLRGTRGRIETVEGRDGEVGRTEPVPGKDVTCTIDIELQHDITEMFRYAKVLNEAESDTLHGKYVFDTVAMHGGAVVIDIPTGEVRALVSYPTYDLNTFDDKYNELVADEVNQPLWNRATQQALNPGSTVKPMVGLGAITDGKVGLHEGIECTGFLVLDGHKYPNGRCWTQSMFGNYASAHHQIPQSDPHRGSFGNPDGFLIFPDAIQRSCNVYFETLGDRLKMEGLSKWFNRFGLGKLTGIGIPESPGSVPTSYRGPADEKRFATWISAIGQGTTTATPLQMANVAATIARGGIWERPRLIPESYGLAPTSRPANTMQEDRVDLHLPKDAIAAAQEGMRRVVNTRAGSAYGIVRRDDLIIAGKTGTAETASRVRVRVRDAAGRPVGGDDRKIKYRYIEPSTPEHPNPEAPWFRGFHGPKKEDGTYSVALKHSWFVGFAPADHPKIAFAVAMEYGGSGGLGAGLVAKQVVASLIEHKYLERTTNPPAPVEDAQPAAASQPAGELLHPVGGD
jgi:penicillin-binding protein 2